ncbi:hypothetical protein HMPREF1227_1127 [Streptococcus pyogenes GA41046]|nr:hypothetical protein HMPREF1227_1127 [Streptococcus pyogenes GA41046]
MTKPKASFFDTCSGSDKPVCFTTLITAEASVCSYLSGVFG